MRGRAGGRAANRLAPHPAPLPAKRGEGEFQSLPQAPYFPPLTETIASAIASSIFLRRR